MKYKLSFSGDVDKFLARLDARQFRQIMRRVMALGDLPLPHDSAKLQGFELYRVDQGEYRIIYHFDDETLYVYLIGKRNDDEVYAKLQRK